MLSKPKVYAIEGSNIEHLGSDEDIKARANAARCEEQWKTAGKEPGVQIWRIENFQVKPWPKERYGEFFSGDSYIVLKTEKQKDLVRWDIHFWLGKLTSMDEAGTAAYKSVELDDFLGTAPIQHREVQGHESNAFLSYFRPAVRVLDGGVESGFNIVKPVEYKPRLLHVKGRHPNVVVMQVPLTRDSLNSGDVFILDNGLNIYQWNGKSSGPFEKNRGAEILRRLDDDRGQKPKTIVLEDGDDNQEFWSLLGGKGPVKNSKDGGDDTQVTVQFKKLFKLSDASGKLEFKEIGSGKLNKAQLDTKDVFVIDVGTEIFVWIGRKSSDNERKSAMFTAQKYLCQQKTRSPHLPITGLKEGQETIEFNNAFL